MQQYRQNASALASACPTSTISTAHRDLPHNLVTASFEKRPLSDAKFTPTTDPIYNRPVDQSVSCDNIANRQIDDTARNEGEGDTYLVQSNTSNVDSSRVLLGRIQSIREDLSHMSQMHSNNQRNVVTGRQSEAHTFTNEPRSDISAADHPHLEQF